MLRASWFDLHRRVDFLRRTVEFFIAELNRCVDVSGVEKDTMSLPTTEGTPPAHHAGKLTSRTGSTTNPVPHPRLLVLRHDLPPPETS